MDGIKTYCIAMERETNQRSRVSVMFAQQQVPFEFFDGIDGRAPLTETQTKALHPLARWIGHPSVIGCGLSHFTLWQNLLQQNDDDDTLYMICESDVVLCKDFPQKLRACLAEAPIDFDILFVGNRNFSPSRMTSNNILFNILFGSNKECRRLSQSRYQPDICLTTHCYIVTRHGLAALIAATDSKLGWHIDHLVQNSSVRVEAVFPPLAEQNDQEQSSIADKNQFPVSLNHYLDVPVENGFSAAYWMNCPIGQVGSIPLNFWVLFVLLVVLLLCFVQVPWISIVAVLGAVCLFDVGWVCSKSNLTKRTYPVLQVLLLSIVVSAPSFLRNVY